VADFTFPKVPFPSVFPQIGREGTDHVTADCAGSCGVELLSFCLEIFVHYLNRLLIILIQSQETNTKIDSNFKELVKMTQFIVENRKKKIKIYHLLYPQKDFRKIIGRK